MIEKSGREDVAPEPGTYEPPAVDDVLKPEDLKREVLYAGGVNSIPPPS